MGKNLPSHSEPLSTLRSRITSDDLEKLSKSFSIDDRYQLRVPRANESPLSAHPNEVCLYTDFFTSGGLSLPVNFEVAQFLSDVALAPCRLVPNAMTHIHCFVGLCLKHQLDCTPRVFRQFFSVKTMGGFWYVSPRPRSFIFTDFPSSIHDWKKRFFFASSSDPAEPFPFVSCSTSPRILDNYVPRLSDLTEAERQTLKFLSSRCSSELGGRISAPDFLKGNKPRPGPLGRLSTLHHGTPLIPSFSCRFFSRL